MKRKILITLYLITLVVINLKSKDTFSIVAIDTITGEVYEKLWQPNGNKGIYRTSLKNII